VGRREQCSGVEKLEARKILVEAARRPYGRQFPASSAPPEKENVLFPQRNRGAMGVYCTWQTYKLPCGQSSGDMR